MTAAADSSASCRNTTETAQAARADYAAPTLSLLFVQSTEGGTGTPNDAGSVGSSNPVG